MEKPIPPGFYRIAAVYGSGFLIGIALILFPSAGPLLTDPARHHLSGAQYGLLFTPQIGLAVAASLLTAVLARRLPMRRILLAGLWFGLLSMGLFGASALAVRQGFPSFPLLLGATGAVGAGFGLAISALNALAFALFPGRENAAVTALHVATGSGQVGAGLILSFFLGRGIWWGAPLLVAGLLLGMILVQIGRPLDRMEAPPAPAAARTRGGLPGRIWLWALLTFAYGAIEGTFGNWTPIYLEQNARLTAAEAALGLSLFWGAVTTGRVLFALLAVRVEPKPLFYLSPFAVGVVFLVLPRLQSAGGLYTALIAAGLALSFYFPYAVSLGSAEVPWLAAAVSGSLVAGLQLGNGVSANLVGAAGRSLPLGTVFQLSAGYAVLMAGLALYLGLSAGRDRPIRRLPAVQSWEKQP